MGSRVGSCIISQGDPPPELIGSTLVCTEKYLYVVGGETLYNVPLVTDVWRLHRLENRWTKLGITDETPHRTGTTSAFKFHNCLVLFRASVASEHPYALNTPTMYVCHLADSEDSSSIRWKSFRTRGHQVALNSRSTFAVDECFVYCVTSPIEDRVPNSFQVFQFDFRARFWTLLYPTGGANHCVSSERGFGFEIALNRGKIYVLQGFNPRMTIYYLYRIPVYDLVSSAWTYRKSLPDPLNGYPSQRKWHTFAHSTTSDFVLFSGGMSYKQRHLKPLSSIWRLTLGNLQWERLEPTLEKPTCLHSSALSPDNRLYVFGGCQSRELPTNSVVVIDIDVPKLRALCLNVILKHEPWMFCESRSVLAERGIPDSIISLILS